MLLNHSSSQAYRPVPPDNGHYSEDRYWELATRLLAHESMCEERSKNVSERLDKIEDGVKNINQWGLVIGFTLICSMAGILVTLLLK
jgi:hypothetical protein